MYAFALIHFGKNPKYLEYEIFFLLNLKRYTTHDILYLYSINDTLNEFVNIIQKYCTKVIPYDDKGITYDIENKFESSYKYFNTLRTCNFIFAYNLIEYTKICLLESDMIILKNIDDVFNLKTPSILSHITKNIFENNLIINNRDFNYECKHSSVNGGTLLIEPNISKFELYKKNIKKIIKNNCMYPNETLFVITNKKFYNMPFQYNGLKHGLNKLTLKELDLLKIIHLNSSEFKHINIIKNNYYNQMKKKHKVLVDFIKIYKKKYYNLNKNIVKNNIDKINKV